MQSHTESTQTLHLFCLYQNHDFFSAYLSDKQYCVHYILALEACEHFMTLFRQRLFNQKTYFPLKCVFFIFLIYVSLRKY